MSEQEFTKEAKKRGLREENIKSAIEDYKFLKEKTLPDLELNESIIDIALNTQIRIDNEPDGMVSLD